MGTTRFHLLAKLIVSYVLVLILPVLVILLYYYPYSTQIAKQKEMDWNAHMTEKVKNSMEIFTRYVYNLPFELVNNREIKLYMAGEDEYQRIVISREMAKYNATDGFIDNTFLYVKSIGYMFAKTGSAYSIQDFAIPGVGYYYPNWSIQAMRNKLNGLTAPEVRPVEDVIVPGNNRTRVLTFLLPLPVGGENSPGALMIMVREDTIVRLMQSAAQSHNGDFFIFDSAGNRLVASNETPYSGSSDFKALVSRLDASQPGSGIYQIDGKSYIVSHDASDRNGWKYVTLLAVTETLHDIRTIQRNTILLIALIMITEIVVIYISVRNNYQPINRLVQLAKNMFAPRDSKAMNEIDTIRFALDQLSSANSQLDERVKGTIPVMRENVLFELVSERYESWEAFRNQAAPYGIVFGHDLYSVAVLSCEPGEDGSGAAAAAECCRRKENDLPDGLQGYFFNSVYEREVVFVCSHTADFSLKTFLIELCQELAEQAGVRALIGIGSPGSSPAEVHASYLQALRTAEYLRVRNQFAVLLFHEIDIQQTGAVSYFAEQLQSLELCILKNDASAVEAAMERICDYIGDDKTPAHMVRAVYLNTVIVIFNGLQRFRQTDQLLLQLTGVASLHRYTTRQMIDILRSSCDKLCVLIRGTQAPSRAATANEILSFIERKGTDSDLSLQMIADHFNMTLSNFSYHFKKTTGQNFKEYVDRYRIQKSIQLLRSSDKPLDAIAQQVGYLNASSFIRSFKKTVGMTPGQFRNADANSIF
jgi:AraC-like DNA-binding protein